MVDGRADLHPLAAAGRLGAAWSGRRFMGGEQPKLGALQRRSMIDATIPEAPALPLTLT
jgi:hypothetical protein